MRTGGKLSFDDPKIILNKKDPNQPVPCDRREIFKGFYEYDIEVAIQRMLLSGSLMREIEREFAILRQLNNHENFIRYFAYETDDRKEFV